MDTKRWYDKGSIKPDGKITWNELFEMCSLDCKNDHIYYEENATVNRARDTSTYVYSYKTIFKSVMFIFLLFISILSLFLIYYDGFSWTIEQFFRFYFFSSNIVETYPEPTSLININANLTAFIAIIASFSAIFIAYDQLRAKVRADNRQEWINKVRILISDIVGLLPVSRYACKKEVTKRRIELELMLNPSEKDHRLLSYLIRRALNVDFKIKPDRNLRDIISEEGNHHIDDDLYQYIFVGEAISPEQLNDLISYIMLISHIVIKREWERVKHIR
ncbi:MAG: hypothetical protein OEL53_06720 [Rhodospirillales bacterium]|nr:hypothetical protein [Rhodospirillales bacterium]